jgi:hypothetical protein
LVDARVAEPTLCLIYVKPQQPTARISSNL